MTEYQLGYLQGLRDALVAADGSGAAWQAVANVRTLLTNFIARFKK